MLGIFDTREGSGWCYDRFAKNALLYSWWFLFDVISLFIFTLLHMSTLRTEGPLTLAYCTNCCLV